MATPIAGYVGVGSGLVPTSTVNQYQRAVQQKIALFKPQRYILFTFLEGSLVDGRISPIGQEPLHSTGVFEVYEMEPTPTTVTLTADATNAATALTVTDCRHFSTYDRVMVTRNPLGTDGEILRVASKPASPYTTLTVETRGTWGTAAAIGAGALLKSIGPAIDARGVKFDSTTGMHSRGAVQPGLDHIYGACQLFEEETGLDWRVGCAQTVFGGSMWPKYLQDCVDRLKYSVEASLWVNAAADFTTTSTITSGELVYTSAGVNGRISTNRFPGGGNLTWSDLVDICGVFQERTAGADGLVVGFGGRRIMGQIGKWGENKMQTIPGDRDPYGFAAGEVIVPGFRQKTLRIYQAPVLEESILENMLILLDLSQLTLIYMENTTQGINYNIRAVGEDGKDIQAAGSMNVLKKFEAAVGLRMALEKRHLMITDVATPHF